MRRPVDNGCGRRRGGDRTVSAPADELAYPSLLGVAPLDADDANDPFEVVDRGELDDDLPLAAADVDPDPGVEPVGEPVGEIRQGRRVWPSPALGGRGLAGRTAV